MDGGEQEEVDEGGEEGKRCKRTESNHLWSQAIFETWLEKIA